jgi:SAM-dependent methyltransferase
MSAEVWNRLRNAFAAVALDHLARREEAGVPQVFQPPFSSMTAADWRTAVALWRTHAEPLLRDVPARACPACGSGESRFLFVSYDAHPFHECETCGCWFVPKMVDSTLFDRLFDRSEEARALAAHMMRERDQAAQREADLARIGGYLDALMPLLPESTRPRAYLDTGCGVGHSLRAGLARGLVVQGVEVDTTAVALARADGLPVATPGDPIPPGPYDLLSFWETLEHIADPLGALQAFVPFLAPTGLVAITVPNMGSPQSRILREACSWVHGGYNTPGHVNLFHPASMARLLERAGLTVLDADGQFSNNPIELAAYLAGESRGAFDALAAVPAPGGLPAGITEMLTTVWPGVALLERLALASPILAVVACRRGEAHRFSSAIAARRRARQEDIATAARMLVASEPDYRAMAEALQREVDARDQLLAHNNREAQARFDAVLHEVAVRDGMLRDMEGHLHAAQERFNRTIEGRLRARLGPYLRKFRGR